jgi:hypothetical protein
MAVVATLLAAMSAVAASIPPPIPHPNVYFPFAAWGAASGPSTTNNDDGCDIGLAPAATLLLPYFEVDLDSPQDKAQTTLFTVINTNHLPAIARVTLWTDYAYPVLAFNIFLTGYGMQSIDLYDVIQRGVIPRTSGTIGSGRGALSAGNNGNPNIAESAGAACLDLPGTVPVGLLADVQKSLTIGVILNTCGTNRVGGTHYNAIGYATIDVVNSCTSTMPNKGAYYASDLLFDNWLTGDYQQLNPNPVTGNYAAGNPMVHIRAVPEGGPAGSVPFGVTNLPYTFYARYVQNTGLGALNPQFRDRRQPLPATFAARYIQGGEGAFNTSYKIWREGRELVAAPAGYGVGATIATGSCTSVIVNATISVFEIVRFDEHENSTVFEQGFIFSSVDRTAGHDRSDRNRSPTMFVPADNTLPTASNTPTSSGTFPPISTSGDLGGWMYLNLRSFAVAGSSTRGPGPAPGRVNVMHPNFGEPVSQNWVVVSMFAEGRYATDFDAAWLGNGCTPAINISTADVSSPISYPPRQSPTVILGPAGLTPVCPFSETSIGCMPGVAPYVGSNLTP